jgi:serine/threonine protein kinase
VLAAGQCDAACYVVLPHVAGDLQTQRPASIVQVLRLLYQVCQALDHAHHGIPPLVHRRLKSTNVLLTGPGHATVADLALAEALEVDLAGLAQLGLLGPLTYTAPRRPLPRGPRLVAAPPCSTPPCRRPSRRPLVAALYHQGLHACGGMITVGQPRLSSRWCTRRPTVIRTLRPTWRPRGER